MCAGRFYYQPQIKSEPQPISKVEKIDTENQRRKLCLNNNMAKSSTKKIHIYEYYIYAPKTYIDTACVKTHASSRLKKMTLNIV